MSPGWAPSIKSRVASEALGLLLLLAMTVSSPAGARPEHTGETGTPSEGWGAAHQRPSAAPDTNVFAKLPIHFVPNMGQTDQAVKFIGRGNGGLVLLMDDGGLSLLDAGSAAPQPRQVEISRSTPKEDLARPVLFRQRLIGANPHPSVEGTRPRTGRSSFFLDSAPQRWRRGLPHYERVSYRALYPGIDLVYYGNGRAVEYDFVIAPGADTRLIDIAFEGPRRISLDEQGHLLLQFLTRALRLERPDIYQVVGGERRAVAGSYLLEPGNRVRFKIDSREYDPHLPLVIDPRLHYSTFLGGDAQDYGMDIALDSEGNVYVTGETRSADFPLRNPVRDTIGTRDAFVAKLDPTLTTLIYATYLGGSGAERGNSIAVDADGNAYVTGFSYSSNFPATTGALDTACGTDGQCNPHIAGGAIRQYADAFVVKLDPAGDLVYGTYLGNSRSDIGSGVAVDRLGSVYLTGWTQSRNFPTTAGVFQSSCRGGNPLSDSCPSEVFVARLNPAGNELVYSTFLGGSSRDDGFDIALDTTPGLASAAYVTGFTQSDDFPTTSGAFQRSANEGLSEAFVVKLNPLGTALVYSTYLGGSDYDDCRSIVVDRLGQAYVLGQTASSDFPTTSGAFDTTCGTDGDCNFTGTGRYVDAFVTKLNPEGSALAYSTYLGGSLIEFVGGIVVDEDFNAYVTGETTSADFPLANPVQSSNNDSAEVFVAKLNPNGNGLVYSTYLGGIWSDHGSAIAIDRARNAYFTGLAGPDFPTTAGAFQTSQSDSGSAFVARIGDGLVRPPWADVLWWSVAAAAFFLGVALIFTFTWSRRRARASRVR